MFAAIKMEEQLGKGVENGAESKPDYFARITAIIGLVLAVTAIIVPIWQEHRNEQERLNVWMRVNQNGVVLIPDDRGNSTVIQIPWLFTLSNTGKIKLSITGYDVFQLKHGGLSKFANLVGLVRYPDNTQVVPPIILDAGESKTIMMHIGFMAKADILDKLYQLHGESGAFTLNESFKYLASFGLTIYGGKAMNENHGGLSHITIDPDSIQMEPVYRVEFKTGRGENFYVQGSETLSKFSS